MNLGKNIIIEYNLKKNTIMNTQTQKTITIGEAITVVAVAILSITAIVLGVMFSIQF